MRGEGTATDRAVVVRGPPVGQAVFTERMSTAGPAKIRWSRVLQTNRALARAHVGVRRGWMWLAKRRGGVNARKHKY